ncbi:MAG: transcription elongation factor subunit Spt4 [Promethearchaeota archaeon]
MVKLKACKICHVIVEEEQQCPNCKQPGTLSKDFAGLVVIIDPDDSAIAQKLNVTRPGRYAIRVR